MVAGCEAVAVCAVITHAQVPCPPVPHMLPLMELPCELLCLILAEVASGCDGLIRLRATNKHLSCVLAMRASTTCLFLKHTLLLMHFSTLQEFRTDYFDDDGSLNMKMDKKMVHLTNDLLKSQLQCSHRCAVLQGKAARDNANMELPGPVVRGQARLADALLKHELTVAAAARKTKIN